MNTIQKTDNQPINKPKPEVDIFGRPVEDEERTKKAVAPQPKVIQ